MFTAILAIVAVIVILGGIVYFLYDKIDYISSLIQWAHDMISSFSAALPDWLIPFVAFALVLSVVSILVKLL